jgi:rSAM/selenodomain-associated transferase 1
MGLFTAKSNSDENDGGTFYLHTSKNALIIFTRNPELGKVKTRLAKVIGDDAALRIYKFLIDHTINITSGLDADKFVYYSENIIENDMWDNTMYRKRLQKGSDLGARMEHAFNELITEGYEQVIIIGSDLYDLQKTDLQKAFDALLSNDFVVGPATDGGYYLLGMKTLNRSVFKNKTWGESNVLKDTLKDLEGEQFTLLEKRNDVDHYEDIEQVDEFRPFLGHLKKTK